MILLAVDSQHVLLSCRHSQSVGKCNGCSFKVQQIQSGTFQTLTSCVWHDSLCRCPHIGFWERPFTSPLVLFLDGSLRRDEHFAHDVSQCSGSVVGRWENTLKKTYVRANAKDFRFVVLTILFMQCRFAALRPFKLPDHSCHPRGWLMQGWESEFAWVEGFL